MLNARAFILKLGNKRETNQLLMREEEGTELPF